MKMTYQPKTRQRKKEHGFRKRMITKNGRKCFKEKKTKRKKSFISIETAESGLFVMIL